MLQDAIKELRKKHNLSQVQFAKRLNVTQGAVSQWEKGATRPDTDMLARISSEFGVGIDDLMQGEVRETNEMTKRRPLTDEEIMFGLWGTDAQNITKAQFDQVKAFARFIKDGNGKN
jgi:transcriptional regulator with XRE-family HTH domain